MECIICFNDVSYNDYIQMECCNQLVHINCLTIWISSNIVKNTEITKCFYCRSSSELIENIMHDTNIVQNNHLLLENISDNTNINIDIANIDSNDIQYVNNNMNNHTIIIKALKCISGFFIFGILVSYIIITNNT